MFKIKKILSKVRKAIDDYGMINDGDKIAVGVSGGKDSLTLLYALNSLKRFYPKKFDIIAITLSLGFDNFDINSILSHYDEIGCDYHIEDTIISRIVFEERKEKNPCSLCSNMKRGAIYNAAKALGCNKVAFGHHMDDVIETFLLSLLYEGRINTFSPVTYLDRRNITLIRPMIYVEEKMVKAFTKQNDIISVKSGCLVDGSTKREEIKNLISTLKINNKHIKSNLFGSIKRAKLNGF